MVLVASVVSTQPAWPQVAYLSMTRQTPKCALLPLCECGIAGVGWCMCGLCGKREVAEARRVAHRAAGLTAIAARGQR
jgi:hypothetical protein